MICINKLSLIVSNILSYKVHAKRKYRNLLRIFVHIAPAWPSSVIGEIQKYVISL